MFLLDIVRHTSALLELQAFPEELHERKPDVPLESKNREETLQSPSQRSSIGSAAVPMPRTRPSTVQSGAWFSSTTVFRLARDV